jgi:hypothetical protein
MEMITANRRLPGHTIFAGFGDEGDDLPVLPPIVAHEATADGWRGLTARGEVFEVRGGRVPTDDFIEMRDGQAVGRRAITNERAVDIGRYLDHFGRAIELYRANQCDAALAEIDAAVALVPTVQARFNRAMILLAGGRWREGFAQYEDRLEFGSPPFPLPPAGIQRWLGEDLAGKTLLLVSEQGFGDTIMCLRFVPMLCVMGADVVLDVPEALERLAAPVARLAAPVREYFDFWCPMLSLLHVLGVTPQSVPTTPYLNVDASLAAAMHETIDRAGGRKRVGIAWSAGSVVDGDFPRAIPLPLLVNVLGGDDIELYSLQAQGATEAAAFGVQTPELADFADVAALASLMDQIVSIDTAALHVAGAIGHPNVTALLSHWCSWRWRGNLFYPAIKLCRQTASGDWASALAQI